MHNGTPVHANELGKTIISLFTMAQEKILIGTWTRLAGLSSHQPSNGSKRGQSQLGFCADQTSHARESSLPQPRLSGGWLRGWLWSIALILQVQRSLQVARHLVMAPSLAANMRMGLPVKDIECQAAAIVCWKPSTLGQKNSNLKHLPICMFAWRSTRSGCSSSHSNVENTLSSFSSHVIMLVRPSTLHPLRYTSLSSTAFRAWQILAIIHRLIDSIFVLWVDNEVKVPKIVHGLKSKSKAPLIS